MQVIHLVPPAYDVYLRSDRNLTMTFVDWVLDDQQYAEFLRQDTGYKILNHSTFEVIKDIPTALRILLAAYRVGATEIVLPDTLGAPKETLEASLKALSLLTRSTVPGFMFVPQARAFEDWEKCLKAFLSKAGAAKDKLVIGLSSLRRAEGFRFQRHTRVQMMRTVSALGLPAHLLGTNSLMDFLVDELPAAIEYGVRSMDTCLAFALGARGLELTPESPRVFLGDPQKYDSLTTDRLELIRRNIDTFDLWVKGE